MDRILIKKLRDDETVYLDDTNFIFSPLQVINRLHEICETYGEKTSDEMLKILMEPKWGI